MVLFRRQIDSSLVNMSYCSRFYKMFSWKAGLRILDQHVIDSHVAFREFRFILVLNTCNMFSGIWFCNKNNSNKKLVKCVFLGILFSMYRFFSPSSFHLWNTVKFTSANLQLVWFSCCMVSSVVTQWMSWRVEIWNSCKSSHFCSVAHTVLSVITQVINMWAEHPKQKLLQSRIQDTSKINT